MTEHRPRLSLTRTIPKPTYYITAIDNEFGEYAFNEEKSPIFKGLWRSEVFKVDQSTPIDLEFGTGNGQHFTHHSLTHPQRCIVGFELKYKPLIQSIRRTLNRGAKNARILRYHAHNADLVFAPNEVNNVYIHFPDPWERPKKFKNRIVCETFLKRLYELQQNNSFVEFKTDSRDYFLWALDEIAKSPYKLEYHTLDLHQSPHKEKNFITTFEKIFLKEGLPINACRLIKSE
jgi:tRNA (guanine-N7-)-methyltransferase